LELEVGQDVSRHLQQRIKIDVTQVTYEVLLQQVFAETPLGFELAGQRLRVFVK
jgi:hypothetical protein